MSYDFNNVVSEWEKRNQELIEIWKKDNPTLVLLPNLLKMFFTHEQVVTILQCITSALSSMD